MFNHIQFNHPGKNNENSIYIYPLIHSSVISSFSKILAIKTVTNGLYDYWQGNKGFSNDPENPLLVEIHSMLSIIKPLSTWMAQKSILECKEQCGYFGISKHSEINEIVKEIGF